MQLAGMQKLTLLDYPQTVACTIFANGCNLKCPFCHNSELINSINNTIYDIKEIKNFLKRRRNGLLDGICISGGEPTLQSDLVDFVKFCKDLGYKVKLDTNGTNPKVLENLINLVDYIAMDIKSSKEKYNLLCGKEVDLSAISQSAKLLQSANVDYEFRTTVVRPLHDEEDFKRIGEWLQGAKKYFLQAFRQNENVVDKSLMIPSDEEMDKYLTIVRKYIPHTQIRGK